jgi:integrase
MANKRGNNEGTIFKRKNGTWRAQVTADGKRLSYSGKTRSECQTWIRSTLQRVDNGLTFDKTQVTVEMFLKNMFASMKSTLRPSTWTQYDQIVRDHINPSLGRIKVVDLRPDLIQELYDRKVDAGVGLRTIQLTHAVLRRSLNRAVKLGLLLSNPTEATSPPKPVKKEMQILDDSQVQRLLITAEAIQVRNLALYQLAITTGMRQGELLGLKWQDVKWEQRTLRIQRQLKYITDDGPVFAQLKTHSSARTLVLGTGTTAILIQHQERQISEITRVGKKWKDHDLVFPSTIGTPFNPRNLSRQYKSLLNEAGLPSIRFHDLRHTAASLMLNHGIPVLIVSKRLGHAKPSITLDIYGHLIPSMQEQVAQMMDEVVTRIEFEQVAPRCTTQYQSDLEELKSPPTYR